MIPSRLVFEDHAADYDTWFDDHAGEYQAQLRILGGAVGNFRRGLEVGVGSGRFAVPLDIHWGIDPSQSLTAMAKHRGIEVIRGEAEHLPYRAGSFDLVLMMTVICFLDDIQRAFRESYRTLEAGGTLFVGFIEAGGKIFQKYQHEPAKGRFLRFATFRTEEEVYRFFKGAGFEGISVVHRVRGFCMMRGRKKECGEMCWPIQRSPDPGF